MIAKRTVQSAQKETTEWFLYHFIVEYNAGIIEIDLSLMSLLLKVFVMFQIRLF